MKLIPRILSLLLLASAVIFLSNCKKDDPEPSEEQTQLNKLKGSWQITEASLAGTNRTDVTGTLVIEGNYAGDGGTYNYYFSSASMPNPSPWPLQTSASKGTWTFGPNVESQIVRSPDSMQISYGLSSSGDQLTLTFVCETCNFPGGTIRSKAVQGSWQFVLQKQ